MRVLIALVLFSVGLSGCQTMPSSASPADQKNAEVMVELGIGYMREGNYEVALDRLVKAIDLDPGSAVAHDAIANLYERLEKPDQADKHYQKALRLDAQSAATHNNYGRFLCTAGKYEEAEKEFAAAYNDPLYERPWLAWTNAGTCARTQGEDETAEKMFRTALQENPVFAPALAQMVSLTFEQKRFYPTRAYLQRYLEVAPHTAQTLWVGIQTESELGDLDAVASYSLLLKAEFPDSEQARLLEAIEGGQ